MTKKELVLKAKEAYYNSGEPIMSDAEYDLLIREVGETTVGAPVLDSLKKIDISDKPMLSLDKCHTVEEIIEFANGHDLVASVKCDGLSVRIIYEDGKIVSANTRGDGQVGQDITEHIKQFKNVPKTIPTKERIVVDGEAVILQHDFDEINEGGQFKNPRNLAAGTLASLDTSLCGSRRLSFIAWDLIEGYDLNTYNKKIIKMKALGFTVVPHCMTEYQLYDNEYFDRFNLNIINAAKENGIPCDGVVYKFNDIAYGDSLGKTAHHFLNGIAWKPAITEVETELLDIEWSMGRTGVLTPVAIFKPVDLLGSTVSRASLHNLSILRETLGLYPEERQSIWVYKANEIIPQISKANKNNSLHDHVLDNNGMNLFCPICGNLTEIKNNEGVLTVYCTNPECTGKLSQRVDHFLGKKGLDAKGISRATIDKLVEWDWIKEIKDVFTLDSRKREWSNKPGFGEKSVDKILASIEGVKHCTLESVIAGAGIPLVGRTVAKDIAKKLGTYDAFRKAIYDPDFKFSNWDGYGYEINKALKKFDYTELDYIVNEFLTIEEVKDAGPTADTVKGLIFCITGKLSRKRDDIKADIEAAGGKVGSSVTGKTNYLVCNQPEDTTKYHAAEDKGIPIITEEQLMEMLG